MMLKKIKKIALRIVLDRVLSIKYFRFLNVKPVLLLTTGYLLLTTCSTHAFYDVTPEDPQHHIFTHLQEVGVMHAYQDGNYYPSQAVSRAEALVIAMRAGRIPVGEDFTGKVFFEDVEPTVWYAPYIEKAIEKRIVATTNYYFQPDEAITKAEFLAMLFRSTRVDFRHFMSQLHGVALDISTEDWFAPHFAYAKKYQIAYLPPDEFYRPNKILTRREVAMMTYRQSRVFFGDEMTEAFVELQAEIQQFISLLKGGKEDKAEMHLQNILTLNDKLVRMKNDTDAIAASAISRTMTHLAESLRFFRRGRNLAGIENLHLAAKQVTRAGKKSGTFIPFVEELSHLIADTMDNFISPIGGDYTLVK